MTYERSEENTYERSEENFEIENLLHVARAGNSVLSFKTELEQKSEAEAKKIAQGFEKALKESGSELEAIKKAIKECLDPFRQNEKLPLLEEISYSKGEFLRRALKIVHKRFHAQTAAIFLINKDGLLKRFSIFGVDKHGNEIEPNWYKEEAYPVNSESFVGRAATPAEDIEDIEDVEEYGEYGQFQFTADLENESNLDEKSKQMYFEKCGTLRGAIAVPLNGRNRTYGVLRIVNEIDPATKAVLVSSIFKELNVAWLSLLATYIANALSNFRRDVQTRILEFLNGQIANPSSSITNYYQETIRYYQNILDLLVMNSETAFKAGVLRLIDDETQTLKVVATSIFSSDVERDDKPRKIGEGLAGSVAESRQRLILTDISNTEFYNKPWVSQNSFKTFSCFPLISRGNLLGTLSLYTAYNYDYHDDSINFLQSVADSIATFTLLEFGGNKQRLSDFLMQYELKQQEQKRNLALDEKDVEQRIVRSIKDQPDTPHQKSGDRTSPSSSFLDTNQLDPNQISQPSSSADMSGKEEPRLYRFALPKHSTAKQRQHFQQSIQALRNEHTEWEVFQDRLRPNEEEAVLVTKAREESLYYYVAYAMTLSITEMFHSLQGGR
jgi:GAF domain-containing protein